MDAGYVVFIDKGPDLSGCLFLHPGADLFIAAFEVLRLFLDPGGVLLQDLPQFPGDHRDVRFGLFQFMGIQVYIFHADGGGQNVHIPVQDVPPVAADGSAAALVPQGLPGIIVIIPDHQAVQPPQHRQKQCNTQHQHHQADPSVLAGVPAQAVVFLPVSPHLPSPYIKTGQQGKPSPPVQLLMQLYGEAPQLFPEAVPEPQDLILQCQFRLRDRHGHPDLFCFQLGFGYQA